MSETDYKYHFDQRPNDHGPLPTEGEKARYKIPEWLGSFFDKYKGPILAVGTGTSTALVAGTAMAAENPAAETANTNVLASLLQNIDIPQPFLDRFYSFFLNNTPGNILQGDPEKVSGFIEFDPRPGPDAAYFQVPGTEGSRNIIIYNHKTKKVLYSSVDILSLPGGGYLDLAEINNRFGEPEEMRPSSLEPHTNILNYSTQGMVIRVKDIGGQSIASRAEFFEPLKSADEYYETWGHDEIEYYGPSGK